MQPKKREITKKNVSVPVLFLYFKSYLYKTLIYSVLSYIKITFSRFRFGNNDVFRLGYSVNTELMHEGDTCVLDMADGLWGLKVCRGVTCNGERIWKD